MPVTSSVIARAPGLPALVLVHGLVINLLFITFNPLGWANNPVLGRDDGNG